MDGRLRVFISSTMRDLANERAEVFRRLEEMNLNPVAAGQNLLSTGQGSWERLKSAIEECDLFVLILGESYGWIPDSGPMAEKKLSVTELELNAARAIGIPVLVFVKRLDGSLPRDSEDAKRRDRFRSEVEEWDGGLFRSEFDLARDLAEDVQKAVTSVVADRFRAAQMQERRRGRERIHPPDRIPPDRPALPDDLVEAVANGSAVVLLGAGASLEAGTPSAKTFMDAMTRLIQQLQPGYEPSAAGSAFSAVATDFRALLGQEALQNLARALVDPAFAEPTVAHRLALELFDTVLTTNYDRLLEKAMEAERPFQVIDGAAEHPPAGGTRRLFKLHGSIEHPAGLVLTESELANLEVTHGEMWRALVNLLSSRPLLSIGSSLRDSSLIRLLEACRSEIRGWAVMGEFGLAEERRLQRWNLTIVPGDANSVMSALAERLSTQTGLPSAETQGGEKRRDPNGDHGDRCQRSGGGAEVR